MWKMGLIAGGVNLALGLGINLFVSLVLPGVASEYQNSALFRPWSDPLMLVYFVYPFILGVVLAYLWGRMREQFSGTVRERAIQFGKLYFMIATIPGMFITYTSMQISLLMVLVWAVTGLAQGIAAGWVFAKREG